MRYSKSADTAAPDGSGGVSPANPRIGGLNAIDTVLEDLGQQRLWERRIRRWALAITFLFHGILLSITFPSPGTQLP